MQDIEHILDRLVRDEVYCNVSIFVEEVLTYSPNVDEEEQINMRSIPDYEEAFFQFYNSYTPEEQAQFLDDEDVESIKEFDVDDIQRLCNEYDVDPYEKEVFEYWSVSSTLARKLREYDETVVEDFFGHDIWLRTTTGQSITADSVFERIAKDIQNALNMM